MGLEENGKESSGTPGGGPTVRTPMGLGLGLPLTSQASGPPRPDRKITAFYSHIEKRQGVGDTDKQFQIGKCLSDTRYV